MVDVPSEAEVLAASAAEAGRAEAAADNAAEDAQEAALAAEGAADQVEAVVESASDEITERVVTAVGNIVGPMLESMNARIDDMDLRLTNVATVAVDAQDTAEGVAEAVEEVHLEAPVVVEEPVAADTGLIVADTSEAPREPPQERRKRYRRI